MKLHIPFIQKPSRSLQKTKKTHLKRNNLRQCWFAHVWHLQSDSWWSVNGNKSPRPLDYGFFERALPTASRKKRTKGVVLLVAYSANFRFLRLDIPKFGQQERFVRFFPLRRNNARAVQFWLSRKPSTTKPCNYFILGNWSIHQLSPATRLIYCVCRWSVLPTASMCLALKNR